MTDRYRFCRAALAAGAALLGLVAVTILAGVIPPVKSNVFPLATLGPAVIAFLVNVGFSLLVAASMYAIVRRITAPGHRRPTGILILDAIVVLVLGLSLLDAASAYFDHGEALRTATYLLFASAAVDGIVVLLLLAVIVLLPRPVRAARSD